jgi:hypothetical protein
VARKAKATATQEELEKFEQYLFEMDDVLSAFVSDARREGIDLDYSIESLDRLEALALSKSKDGADAVELLKSRAARYLGEVFRKHSGGRWQLCLEDPKYLYFKLPVVTGYAAVPMEFCPIEVIANFLHSSKLGTLRSAVGSHLEHKRRDADRAM